MAQRQTRRLPLPAMVTQASTDQEPTNLTSRLVERHACGAEVITSRSMEKPSSRTPQRRTIGQPNPSNSSQRMTVAMPLVGGRRTATQVNSDPPLVLGTSATTTTPLTGHWPLLSQTNHHGTKSKTLRRGHHPPQFQQAQWLTPNTKPQ